MRSLLIATLLAAALVPSGCISAASGAPPCPSLSHLLQLHRARQVIRRMGPTFENSVDSVTFTPPLPTTGLGTETYQFDVRVIQPDGSEASLSGGIHRNRNGELALYILSMNREESFRGQRPMDYLFARLISAIPEEVQVMSADLAATNSRRLREGVAAGRTPEQAARETPIYRMGAELGFSEITSPGKNIRSGGLIPFTVRRSPKVPPQIRLPLPQ